MAARRARMVIVFATTIYFAHARGAAHAQQQTDAPPADVTAAARDAYKHGAASYDAGEYAIAAQQLSKADSIVANDVALELALKASVKANDPLLAMELATRADGRKSSAVLAARDEARSKLGARVGRVTVTCPPNTTNTTTTTCSASLDDTRFPTAQQRWVLVGQHRVVITDSNGARQAFQVRVDPNATVEVAGTNAIAATSQTPSRRESLAPNKKAEGGGGVSPLWFWIGLGASAALGGGTLASALDTKSKHEAFARDPSLERSTAGSDAQLRTNLLGAGTAACVVVTAAMGLFFVKWGGGGSSPNDRDTRSARP